MDSNRNRTVSKEVRYSPQHPELHCIPVISISRRLMHNLHSPYNTPLNTKHRTSTHNQAHSPIESRQTKIIVAQGTTYRRLKRPEK